MSSISAKCLPPKYGVFLSTERKRSGRGYAYDRRIQSVTTEANSKENNTNAQAFKPESQLATPFFYLNESIRITISSVT